MKARSRKRSPPPNSGVRASDLTPEQVEAWRADRERWLEEQKTNGAQLYTASELLDSALRHLGQIVVEARRLRAETRGLEQNSTDPTYLKHYCPFVLGGADDLFEHSALAIEALLTAQDEVLEVWRHRQPPEVVR